MSQTSRMVLLLGLGGVAVGCAHLKPTPDEFGDPVVVARSPSYEAALAEPEVQRPEPNSGFKPDCATVTRGTVQHWPTWYNDPFADKGSEDRRFEITGEDFFAVLYCPARFTINTAALPVSAIVELPWRETYSDGRVGTKPFEDHDANKSPLATAGGAPMEEPLVDPGTVPPRNEPTGMNRRLPMLPDAAGQPASGSYQPLPPEKM